MAYRHNQDLRLGEAVVPDGLGGYGVVHGFLRGIPTVARQEAEPVTCRFLMEESIKMIPANFST